MKAISSQIFGGFLILCFYIIEPVFRIRLIPMASRLGEFALKTSLFMKRQEIEGKPKRTFYVFISGPPVNQQLLKMFKRKLFILETSKVRILRILPYWLLERTRFLINLEQHSNEFFEFNSGEPLLKFTDKEKERGKSFLKERMGIDIKKDWYVCIFARDSEYMKSFNSKKDYGYHDYRDADINTYKKAVKYIISKGGYVIRMGAVVNRPMDFKHEKFIDYAINCRDDFMDIFLSSTCRFYLGATSGAVDLTTIFHVPKLVVNAVPIGYIPYGRGDMFIPKKIRSIDVAKYIHIKDLLHGSINRPDWLWNGNQFKDMGYEYVDNTEDEILAVTKEMFERLEGTFRETEEDKDLQRNFKALFPKDHWAKPHENKNPIGRDFLRENRELYT